MRQKNFKDYFLRSMLQTKLGSEKSSSSLYRKIDEHSSKASEFVKEMMKRFQKAKVVIDSCRKEVSESVSATPGQPKKKIKTQDAPIKQETIVTERPIPLIQ
jgi:SPX domain protein involved in polyphosphate accumulation